jgi:hypothetical protein
MRGIRVSEEVERRLWSEARWMTSRAESNRWRFGTWVDVVVHYPARGSGFSSVGTTGYPAWFLPWNRPARKKRKG